MISNERRWPSHIQPQRQPYREPIPRQLRPFIQEDTLKSEGLQVERKYFLMMLKENSRGRFLRIAEETNGRSNSIIIPAPGLRDFQKLLEEMVNAASEIPAKNQPPQ
jgi:hypothetical protein